MEKKLKKAIQKETEESKKDEYLIRDWLGNDKSAHHIRFKNVYDDRYRVDVFTKHHASGDISETIAISDSYFVRVKDGEVRDLTVKSSGNVAARFI